MKEKLGLLSLQEVTLDALDVYCRENLLTDSDVIHIGFTLFGSTC